LAGEVLVFFFVPLSFALELGRWLFAGFFFEVVEAFLLVMYPDKPVAFFFGLTI
jgi:hypothetical protein